IKNILFTPSEEWDRIAEEPATLKGLFTGYACILAAIGPIARVIGGQVFGANILDFSGHTLVLHQPLTQAIAGALAGYGLNLLGVFVLG
ncbi:YIP1 family protein, partial [Vibrio parahaemolyticus]